MFKIYINNKRNLLFTVILLFSLLNSTVLSSQNSIQKTPEGFGVLEISDLSKFAYINDFNSNNNIPFVSGPNSLNKNTSSKFTAIEDSGVIGVFSKSEKENPHDNYFTVELPEDINLGTHDVVLKYSLYGIDGADQTTKSVNNSVVYGGQSIKINEEWTDVVEYVPSQFINPGENEIFFNRRSDVNYQYKVKDLSIELVEKRIGNIFLTEQRLKNYEGKVHMVGYASQEVESIKVAGETIQIENGMFEHVLENISEETQSITLSYQTNNDKTIVEKFNVEFQAEEINYQFSEADDNTSLLLENTSEYIELYPFESDGSSRETPYDGHELSVIGLDFKELRPLNADVKNVTLGKYLGFRTKTLNVGDSTLLQMHLSYDESKIPNGYSAKDIRTFAFDHEKREWKVLRVDSVDYVKKVILSEYKGDTDYINGVIKVPEMAETSSFTPTTITDMKYADPAAGVVSIAPPSASSTGAATTGFPIKLPAGRNGMAPSLSVNYNSEGGNSWMGVGWNMQLPAITLDTRWGVPRFDTVTETEVYLLNGEPLVQKVGDEYTSPHRHNADINRNTSGVKTFYLRKEGSYLEIIRYGNDPTNYRWRVTDKQGIRSYYGGNNGTVDNERVIRDDSTTSGNITHWALRIKADPFGNYNVYSYTKGMANINGVQAQYFYPQWIRYTLKSGAVSNYYQVDFKRNEYSVGLNETLARVDATTNARTGVLMTTNDLLTEVVVSYRDGQLKPIRTYRFDYEVSAFQKTLLSKIAEYDTEGNLFYSNTMEYYDEVGNNSLIDNNTVAWNGNSSEISSPLHDIAPDSYSIPVGSALGASTSGGFSTGLRAGIGLGKNFWKVDNTIGFSLNYSQSNQKTRVSFIDINGDGLPDKVYKDNSGNIKYMPNFGTVNFGASGNSIGVFGNPQFVDGLDDLSKTKSRTTGGGVDISTSIIGIGASRSKTRASTDGYFADFNGDGLPDLVEGGTVKFNTTSQFTNPNFDNNAVSTQNPIIPGSINPDLIANLELETLNELRAEHSQFDHVKVWTAPYSGYIEVSGSAWLRGKNDCGVPDEINRFRLTVEKSAADNVGNAQVLLNSEKLFTSVGVPQSYSLNNIIVTKGDVFFFRIHNEKYGCGGEVEWNPKIAYTSADNLSNVIDENGKEIFSYNAEEDFIVNNGGGWTPLSEDNSIDIDFNLNSGSLSTFEFSGDLKFIVERIRFKHSQDPATEGEILEDETEVLTWYKTFNPISGNITTSVMPLGFETVPLQYINDYIYTYVYKFYVESESNVKWNEINWTPTISNSVGINHPEMSYKTYDDNVNESKYWSNDNSFATLNIDDNDLDDPLLRVSHNMFQQEYDQFIAPMSDNDFPLEINWIVKEKIGSSTKTLYRNTFYLHRLECTTFWNVSNCEFEYRTADGELINASHPDYELFFQHDLSKEKVQQLKDASGKIYSAFYIDSPVFGQNNPADISISLHPDEVGNFSFTNQNFESPFFASNPRFYGNTYRGWGQFLYNGGLKFEYNDDGDIENINDPDFFDDPIDMSVFDYNTNPSDIQEAIDNADPNTADLNELVIRYVFYGQNNENKSFFNDVIKSNLSTGIKFGKNSNDQLTSTLGRFAEYNLYDLWVNPEELLSGDAFAAMKQRTISKGNATSGNLGLGDLGVSGSVSKAYSKTLNQYLDLNGDRYPDLVTNGNIQFTNMKGGLSNNTIDNSFVSGSRSRDETLGANIAGMFPNSTTRDNGKTTVTNVNSGINGGNGYSYDSRQWTDINGDGLADRIYLNKSEVKVQLNTGYGFSNEIIWGSGYTDLHTSRRDNNGYGAGFGGNTTQSAVEDFGISFAVGFGASEGNATLNAALIDVNGDGLPDLVARVLSTQNEYVFKFYLNNGSRFEETAQQIFFDGASIDKDHSMSGNIYGSVTSGFFVPIFGFIPLKFTFTPSLGINAGMHEKQITVQDIDGDGYPDIIQKGNNNGNITAHLNKVGKTNYLKKVNTPLGGSWTVDYGREGNTYAMPSNKWVLNKITTHDGFEADNDYGPDQSLTTISYEDPLYDRREREFLGFGSVKIDQKNPSSEDTYRYSLNEYHNENVYLMGLTKQSGMYDNGDNVINKERSFYNILDPESPQVDLFSDAADQYLQNGLLESELDHERLFVAPVKTVSTTFEGTDSLSVEQQFTDYDNSGNLLVYKNLGDTYTSSALVDAYRTEMEYYPHILGLYNSTGFVKEVKVIREADNQVLRQRSAEYFKGKISKILVKLNDTETNEVIMQYDIYGNMVESTLSNDFATTIEYDNLLHTYPISSSNSYGYNSVTEYDYMFGIPTLITDINGQQMRSRIDNRGRLLEVTAPNEMPNDWTIRMQYQNESVIPPNFNGSNYVVAANGSFEAMNPGASQPTDSKHQAVTRHNVKQAQNNQLLTVSLADGFGTAIQLKKTLFANSNSSNQLRWMINGKVEKDAFGRAVKTYLPTTQAEYPLNPNLLPASAFNYIVAPNSIPPTISSYDSKDRILTMQQSGEDSISTMYYEIDEGMFATTNTNELEQTVKTYVDVRGRQRKTIQNDELTTQFYYNTIGEKIKVRNHQGYESFYEYDLAGRRVEERNPDRGISKYEFDLVGNLVKKYTSNHLANNTPESISYLYYFNQLKKVQYSQHPENNVEYTYGSDSISDANFQNAIGRLYMQSDASGVQGFGYDKLGNLTNHLRGVAVAGRHTFWYHTEWKYDSHNRVEYIQYPDDEVVSYDYNLGGGLNSISRTIEGVVATDPIISSIEYNNYGERSKVNHGNGTHTAYTYDDRRRIQNLSNQFSGFGITNEYRYDILSNVKNIATVDPASSIPSSGQLGGPVNHNYEYDNYNRLIHADGRYTGPDDYSNSLLAQEYSLDMKYDLAHNIIAKTQTHVQGSVSNFNAGIAVPEVMPKTNYHLEYGGYASGLNISPSAAGEYGYVQPHALRKLIETPDNGPYADNDSRRKKQVMKYDANGNQLEVIEVVYEGAQLPANEGVIEHDSIVKHRNLWDDEDRLRAVDLNPEESKAHPLAVYTYDAGGQRMVRYIPGRIDASSNAKNVSSNTRDEVVMYPSALISAKALSEFGTAPVEGDLVTSYTKHYYIGAERISSTLGTVTDLGLYPPRLDNMFPTIRTLANQSVVEANQGMIATYTALNQGISLGQVTEGHVDKFSHSPDNYDAYWFHKDHLGSSSYISDMNGSVSQHNEYLPFGESLVDEHLNSYNTPYKFNSKELDDETGNYYYGARYYNPKVSTWLSVDPLAEEMPEWSSYNYAFSNPVMFTDPTGMAPEDQIVNPDNVIIKGPKSQEAFNELEKSVNGQLKLSMATNGRVSYQRMYLANGTEVSLSSDAKQLIAAIDNPNIVTNILAKNTINTTGGHLYVGGAFMGNTVSNGKVSAQQEVNPSVLRKFSDANKKPGMAMLHEVTEAYQGALISQKSGISSPRDGVFGSVYSKAHKLAVKQPGDIDLIGYMPVKTKISGMGRSLYRGRIVYPISFNGKSVFTDKVAFKKYSSNGVSIMEIQSKK